MNKQGLLKELHQEGFSKEIIHAFEKVKREEFIPKELHQFSYDNNPLPLVKGSTISQPSTIAFMLSLLELDKLTDNINSCKTIEGGSKQEKPKYSKNEMLNITNINKNKKDKIKILEIGSGSGYVLALMDVILKKLKINDYEIIGLEMIDELVKKSKKLLKHNKKVKILKKDGSAGFKEKVPFDRIIASAAFESIPKHLFEQLHEGGIFVCPVKNSIFQFKKIRGKIEQKEFEGFVFVPMMDRRV